MKNEYPYDDDDIMEDRDSFYLEKRHREKEESMKKNIDTNNRSMWGVHDGIHYYPVYNSKNILKPGLYAFEWNRTLNQSSIKSLEINNDELLILPDSVSEFIINELEDFWEKEEQFKKFNFLWKRGVMLFGPPGSGKTATINIIINNIVKAGGLAFFVTDPAYAKECLSSLRKIEPDRRIVVIMEDIDAIIQSYGDSEILSLLDGELQINNAIFIATTNYPEKLDDRIKNRPSRFDIVKFIDFPTSAARKMFLENKNKRLQKNSKELKKWIDATENMSIAHIKEIIILVEVFNKPFAESVNRIKEMSNCISSDKFKSKGQKIGFA